MKMKKKVLMFCLTAVFISSPVLYPQQKQSGITFKEVLTPVRQKPVFKSNYRLFNHFQVNNLSNKAYWSGIAMSNQEQFEPINDKPRVSPGKLFNEIFMGILGNVAFGVAGGFIGSKLIQDDDSEALIPRGVLLGFFTGSAFGSALGVYITGNSRNIKGSFSSALLGSFLGEGAAILVLFSTQSGTAGLISLIVLPPICSALLFNNSLSFKSSPVFPALLNFNKGDFKIGIPYVHIQPIPGYKKNDKPTIGFNLTLLSVEL